VGKSCRVNKILWLKSGWRYVTQGLILPQIILLLIASLAAPKNTAAEEKGKVVVLPFNVHALKPMDQLVRGLQDLLTHSMWKRGFPVIYSQVVNKHPSAFLKVHEIKDLIKIGRDLGARWVLAGSITQIGKRISLDLRVVDVSGKRAPFFVFGVAEDEDALTDTIVRLAASVDREISGVVQIDSVRVIGNQRIEKEAILAVVKTKSGDPLDAEQLDKDLRNVYRMGFFEDVQTRIQDGPRGKIVTFEVTEKPSIGKFAFVGNKHVDEKDLTKELGIALYTILDENEIRQSINRLMEYYRQKGYYNVEIKDKIEPLPHNEVLVKYEITENEKVYVARIHFVGNKHFDDDDLKDLMETREKGFFSWITQSGVLDKKKLEFDVHKIEAFYQNNGFIKARVGEPKISYEKGEGLIITIEIEEGHPYRVRKVAIEGDMIQPADELLKKVQIKKGDLYNRELVRKDILALREIYVDEGFAYAEVLPHAQEDDKTHLVDIAYKISKGKKVRFERINITGNTITRDKVIRRELKVIEGEEFSGKALKQSTANLHRLGFFEDLEIQTKKGSREDLMVLNVNVKEKPTGSFSVGAGYSSVDQAIAMFSISQNNLRGLGQKLSLSARLGARSSQFDLTFVEPWFLDRPINAAFDAYNWEREYDEFTKNSLGGAVGFGFLLGLDDFTRGTIRYEYDDADITDVDENAAFIIRDMEGRHVTSSLALGITRDSRDRPWNTSSGSINSLTFEYAGGIFGGDVYFNRYTARSAWYFPLFWDTVFVAQGRWGYIQKRSGGELPSYQKFRIGGMNTVRGFDFADISPRDPITGDRVGGETMVIFNAEYRFPFIKEQGVVGLVFFDAGNVYPKDNYYNYVHGLRTSAGVGVRWYSPLGPLRLEYGINLDPQPGEASGRWEFSVGGLF
jgi:outer membrane protein insertion porin family